MVRKNHFSCFDNAYQGFASGNLEEDGWSLRFFAEETNKIMTLQSFAKNFGLYGERAGCVSLVTDSAAETEKV